MTEAEWLACEDPELLVIYIVNLEGRVPSRKMRLFACACCRRLWRKIPDRPCKTAVEVAEHFADAKISRRSLAAIAAEAEQFRVSNYEDNSPLHRAAAGACSTVWPIRNQTEAFDVGTQASRWMRGIADEGEKQESLAHCRWMREIFGNPFKPASIESGWLTPSVTALAQTAYDERLLPSGELDTARLAVLSDALEDAGCTDADILGHLRDAGPHVRGCWVLDLLLGRK
jgi:hypothetical protein